MKIIKEKAEEDTKLTIKEAVNAVNEQNKK